MNSMIPDDFPVIDDGRDYGPRCLECRQRNSSLVGGKAIYPHRPDLYGKAFWLCACGAYCGCHPGTQSPLGFPCGPTTRKARSALHVVMDPLWTNVQHGKKKRRNAVYSFLAERMGKSRDDTHSAMFTAEECRAAIEHLKAFRR